MFSNREGIVIETGEIHIEEDVIKELEKAYPKYSKEEIPDYIKKMIDPVDSVLKEIEEIYEEREKYNLNWAFKNAQHKFDQLFTRILERVSGFKFDIEEKGLLARELKRLSVRKKDIEKFVKRRFNIFSFFSFLVSFANILVSLLIVILISKLANTGETFISSVNLGALFVGFTVFLKVTLSKYIVNPRMNKWGWKKYKKAVNLFKKDLVIIVAASVAIYEAVQKEKGKDEILKLIKVSLKELIAK